VAEQEATRGLIRYETVIATLVGVCALFVSGYTAYVQRQQVRAAVWPILEYNTSNDPNIRFTLDNTGVGPAIIRHVIVRVDGQPVLNWYHALQKLLGPGFHGFSQSSMTGHVLSAGESMTILTPQGTDGNPLTFHRPDALWNQMNKDRYRISIEVCYSSTLGDNWTLRSNGKTGSITTDSRACPQPSVTSFQQ
jgi:hypothetical protein